MIFTRTQFFGTRGGGCSFVSGVQTLITKTGTTNATSLVYSELLSGTLLTSTSITLNKKGRTFVVAAVPYYNYYYFAITRDGQSIPYSSSYVTDTYGQGLWFAWASEELPAGTHTYEIVTAGTAKPLQVGIKVFAIEEE